MRRAVAAVDPDVAVHQVFTVPEASERFQHDIVVVNNTLGGFALLGLVLAAVGLYGVIANLAAHRTAEFGIRLALGARREDGLALILGNGVKLTSAGLVVGGILAYALIRILGSEMPRMAAPDPATLALVVGVLRGGALRLLLARAPGHPRRSDSGPARGVTLALSPMIGLLLAVM